MSKYGIKKDCKHCGTEFETKPRYLEFCTTACKSPINRPGNTPWNKGKKGKQRNHNTDGLATGRAYWKGKKNPSMSERMKGENNPNWEGKVNNTRPKADIDDEFLAYKRLCRLATYKSVKTMRGEGIVPKTGKKKTDLQLDHIIPYGQGYALGLPPEIIGSRANLQYILGSDNRKKWDTFQPNETVIQIQEDYNGV